MTISSVPFAASSNFFYARANIAVFCLVAVSVVAFGGCKARSFNAQKNASGIRQFQETKKEDVFKQPLADWGKFPEPTELNALLEFGSSFVNCHRQQRQFLRPRFYRFQGL